ncbi:MAG: hypothetical protein QOI95_2195 [Acidimicrobiaceae bacterium]|jgi:hypothetical protein
MTLDSILAAFRYQRDGLATSPLYHRLLGLAVDDAEQHGICAEVLAQTPQGVDPVLDALPLRFLGGVHRLVLDGDAPDLARYYPSAGGQFEPDDPELDPGAAFLATVVEHRGRVVESLARTVQTNEVGRCASLLPGFLAVAESTGLPLRILELGTSAGLNLRWDQYRYEGGAEGSAWGTANAALCFTDVYVDPLPRLDVEAVVVDRRGCDRNPIDATSSDGRQLLRSFVWPDQLERMAALDAALALAPLVPVDVDRADASQWVVEQLDRVVNGVATVLFQSIVWQYLTPDTRSAVRDAVKAAGARASASAPVAWLRMEPGVDPTKGAEVRLRQWPGDERVLAISGYHGRPVRLCD